MSDNKSGSQYEVLSPWAKVDPIPLRGISPRVKDLAGKKIGLFRNFKRAARPILAVVEREMRKRYPTTEFSWFDSTATNVLETETENKQKFTDWAKGVDAVVAAVGD